MCNVQQIESFEAVRSNFIMILKLKFNSTYLEGTPHYAYLTKTKLNGINKIKGKYSFLLIHILVTLEI